MPVNQNIKARITPNQNLLVTNYQINAATIRLGDLFDVDGSGTTDGAVILYNGTTSKWVATTQMDNINTIINGGNF
jgi:hypothetical protein|tara:strand:- start:479 stop:706 length:228 start_codon:yes stop_codon:yes gene_type:complete